MLIKCERSQSTSMRSRDVLQRLFDFFVHMASETMPYALASGRAPGSAGWLTGGLLVLSWGCTRRAKLHQSTPWPLRSRSCATARGRECAEMHAPIFPAGVPMRPRYSGLLTRSLCWQLHKVSGGRSYAHFPSRSKYKI